MKKILVLFLVFITGNIFSENTIIAVVDTTPISLNSVQTESSYAGSNQEIIENLNDQIYTTLQLQKVSELNLWPTESDINQVLTDIAQNNSISL